MQNPKTTLAGYALIVATLLTLLAHLMTGGLSASDVSSVVVALGGLGLISATDGGH